MTRRQRPGPANRRGSSRQGTSRQGPSRSGPSRPGQSRPNGPSHRRNDGLGGDQVEGRHAVRELLLANRRPVKEILLAPHAPVAQRDDPTDEPIRTSAALAEIADLAAERRVPVREVSAIKLAEAARSHAPQGVVARARPVQPVPLEALAEETPGRPPLLVVVDGITDPENLGAICRTAEVAGATGIVVPKHRAVRLTPAATKAAAGAIEHLPIALVGGLAATLSKLGEAGLWIAGLTGEADTPVTQLPFADEPLVLVFGSEGKGLSRLVRQRCHLLVSIPVRGQIESLNVGAAAAVALYEVDRVRAVPFADTPG